MPRKAMDYSKSIVYKICCKDIDITDCYVGSTTCLRNRKWQHKSCCDNEKSKVYNYPVYKFIRNNGGWDNWEVVMVEEYPECRSGEELLKYERDHIEMLGATLNKVVIGRTQKEYREDNKEEIRVKKREYHEKNREEKCAKMREYWQKNKENQNVKQREYRQKNKEKICAKAREKVKCDFCGCMSSKTNIARHQKTKKCLKAQGK